MNKIAVNNGIFMGVILMVASMLLYFVNVETFLTMKSYILFFVVLLLYIKTANDLKKSQGGFLSFGEGFKAIFIASVVGFGICTIFEYIHFNLIDPTLADQMKDLTLEKMDEAAGFLSDDMLEKATEAIEDQEFTITLSRSLMNYVVRLVFPAAVVGAIVSLILRKKESEFA